jgi:hypothetical protein
MRSSVLKRLAIEGLVSGKLRLGKVKPRSKSMHDLFTPEELAEQWEEDNTFLLNTATTYYINLSKGYIVINDRKYKFELEDLNLSLDINGDWISTHKMQNNLVCNANSRIGEFIYREIKILGEC